VDLMFRYNFVPLEETRRTLAIAIADPSQLMMIDEISLLLGKRIVTKVATLKQISRHQPDHPAGRHHDLHRPQRRASDIHIETRDDSVYVKYRIDGVLQQAMPPIAKEHTATIISRIKVMSELDIAERACRRTAASACVQGQADRLPRLDHADRSRRRRRAPRARQGIDEREVHKLTLDVLGFDEDDLRVPPLHRRAVRHGAGHRADRQRQDDHALRRAQRDQDDEDKIITIEDPVEYQIRGITQIPVNEKKGLTFARGLRSILRHDPDKIMVGEIRDTETAQIAINSALTGHLVFTTVHANNVVDVLGRFLNMGVEPYNFVSALNCILAQRLVRMICCVRACIGCSFVTGPKCPSSYCKDSSGRVLLI
jgi:type IV pilus assembly protein PilB